MQITKQSKKTLKKNQLIKIKYILQCMVKKGNKSTIETTFKLMLFFMAKNIKIFNHNSWYIISQSLGSITPQIDLKMIKVKRKIFYKLKFITPNRQNFLINSWLSIGTKKKLRTYNKFYKSLAFEFNDIMLKRGESINQYNNFHKFIQKHIRFYNKKELKKT